MTTYTALARYPVMTPRDPAVKDIWGSIMDNAMPLIEQTAAGYISQDLTGLAAYTLTVANNAPDQARAACLRFVGAPPAGGCSVTLPPIARVGWVSNEAAGPVTLMTAGGSVTLSVPAGGAFLYRCDGSAVVAVNLTPSSQVSAANGVVINLGSTYASFDPAGSSRRLLGIDASGNTDLWMGGGTSWRVLNQAGTATLMSITPLGAVTIGGNLAVGGAATVVGAATFGNSAFFNNGFGIFGKDTGGTVHPILSTDSSNNVNTFAGSAAWRVLNQSGTTALLTLTPAGQASLTGDAVFNNGFGVWVKDVAGVARPVIDMDNQNNVNTFAGAAGWRVLNQGGTTTLLTITPAGQANLVGDAIFNNGAGVFGKDTGGTTHPILTTDNLNNVNTFAGSTSWRVLNQAGSQALLTITPGSAAFVAGVTATNFVGAAATLGSTAFGGGNVSCPGTISAAAYVTTSDGRLKTEVAELTPEDGYSWIERARPVSYLMNHRFQTGFIAQDEIDRGRKEAVSEVPDDREAFSVSDGYASPGHRLGRSYEHDIAYFTAAMQGMMARIAALEAAAKDPPWR